MIIERLTFRTHYGQGDALVNLLRRWEKEQPTTTNGGRVTLATDLTGPMFTIYWDHEFADLTSYSEFMNDERATFETEVFRKFFAEMQPLVETADRQLLNVVEVS